MSPIRTALQRLATGAALVSLLPTTSGCGVDLPTAPSAGDMISNPNTVTTASLQTGGPDQMQESDGGTSTTPIWEAPADPVPSRITTVTPTPKKPKKPKKHED